MAILAILVAGLFLSRRVSGPEGADRTFDPAEFREAPTVPAETAHRYVGQRAVVCGTVARVNFARDIRGQPTFINLGRPHPDQTFDGIVWGRDRDRFQVPPEQLYAGAAICILGEVEEHEGTPQIQIRFPGQVRIMREPNPDGLR